MESTLISIIIPTYNRAHLIGETLESVIAQTYKNWECIVVDDGSEDDTFEVVTAFAKAELRISFHHRPKERTKGANSCRNYGLDICNGDFINFFDSDDLMHPDKLKLQIESLINEPKDFNVCQTLVFKGKNHKKGRLRNPNLKSADPFNDFLAHKIKWLTQAPMIRKTILDKYQLRFNEELQQSQELDFIGRMLYYEMSYSIIDKPLVYLREHQASITYGAFDCDKTISSFNARHYFIQEMGERLTQKTRVSLLREIIGIYSSALQKREFFNEHELMLMHVKLRKELNTFNQKMLLLLLKISYSYFDKGEIFKSRLQKLQ